MHKADAKARSIRDGDPVKVYKGRGDFEGLVRVIVATSSR